MELSRDAIIDVRGEKLYILIGGLVKVERPYYLGPVPIKVVGLMNEHTGFKSSLASVNAASVASKAWRIFGASWELPRLDLYPQSTEKWLDGFQVTRTRSLRFGGASG